MRGGRSRPPRIRCRPRVDRIGGVRGVSHPLRDVARRTRVVQEAQSVVSIGQATAGEVPDRRRAGDAGRLLRGGDLTAVCEERANGWRPRSPRLRRSETEGLVDVVVREHLGGEFAAASDPDLGEYRLEMVLDGVFRDVELPGELLGRLALEHQLGDLALPCGESVREKDHGRQLGGCGQLDYDGDVPAMAEPGHLGGVQDRPTT